VFAASTGSFRNDTVCVDGLRGNAAEHLTEELRPYVISHFGAAASPQQWGCRLVHRGTSAIDLAVTHPELFGTFEDIQGDLSPNAGEVQQTVVRLYGGNAQAWAAFDPVIVLAHHGLYPDSAGLVRRLPSRRPRHPWRVELGPRRNQL
jgi:S-formylglutathione hydrolase FrmB